jgi:putative hydrolase of the HAD superfamily
MMRVAPPRALILDLGNVLVFHDNDKLYRELAAASGTTPGQVIDALSSEAGRRMNVTDGPPALVYEIVAPAIGFPGGVEEFAAIWNGIFQPNDAIVPVIEALHGRVPLVVLSNTNAMHMAYLRPLLPILERFDAVLTSHELGAVKPDAAAYLAAVSRASVAPDEAVFFDDVLGHVEGACRAGLRGLLFTDVDQFVADLADLGLPVD